MSKRRYSRIIALLNDVNTPLVAGPRLIMELRGLVAGGPRLHHVFYLNSEALPWLSRNFKPHLVRTGPPGPTGRAAPRGHSYLECQPASDSEVTVENRELFKKNLLPILKQISRVMAWVPIHP